jgi:Protein of unknown function (DUF2934)
MIAAELKARRFTPARFPLVVTCDPAQTTDQRLWEFVEELRQSLQRRLAARRSKEEIRARARELWEHNGRPAGRDLEFWLQAEAELREHRSE